MSEMGVHPFDLQSRAELAIHGLTALVDPARNGLSKEGVDAVAATGAGLCALVSCDVGALGRDAALLVAAGYRHVGSTTLDLFGHTGQAEVVSAFIRDA